MVKPSERKEVAVQAVASAKSVSGGLVGYFQVSEHFYCRYKRELSDQNAEIAIG